MTSSFHPRTVKDHFASLATRRETTELRERKRIPVRGTRAQMAKNERDSGGHKSATKERESKRNM